MHELVNDEDFILEKWGTRSWNNSTYKTVYGNGNHLQVEYNTALPPTHHPEGPLIRTCVTSASTLSEANTTHLTILGSTDSVPEVPVDPITSPSNLSGDHFIEEGSADSNVMVAQPGRTASRNVPRNAPTYCELMKTFGALAADIARRPELSKIWMGLALFTERLVNETSSQEAKRQMLSMTSNMKQVLPNIVNGSVEAAW